MIRAREFLGGLRVSATLDIPPVEAMARWLEMALDALETLKIAPSEHKRERADAFENGRQDGLELAQSLIDTEISDVQESKREAETALSRVWHEIERAKHVATDDYAEPDELEDAPVREPQAAQPLAQQQPVALKDIVLAMFDQPGVRIPRDEVRDQLMVLKRKPKVSAANAGMVIGGLVRLKLLLEVKEPLGSRHQRILVLPKRTS